MVKSPTTSDYRWWPRYAPGTMELGGAGVKGLLSLVVPLLIISGFLALPPISRATGLPGVWAIGLGLSYSACMAFNDFVLNRAALTSRRAFNVQLAVLPIYNLFFCEAVIVIPGDPKSPLWMMPLIFACFTGAWEEIDRSFAYLILHTLAPFVTIPFFLARGADPAWSIAGPALCGVMSGFAYRGFAGKAALWQLVRAEQNATIDELRRQASEAERGRIARDLHDSVGSVLGLVALYGDVIERSADNPEELIRIARQLRESAREGLGDLRGVLDALAPEAADVSALGKTLQRSGRRAAEASGARIEVTITGDSARRLDGPQRLSLVRVFQEALNNALRHGHAKHIQVRLAAPPDRVTLEVSDDGRGFSLETVSLGRGLEGMRSRATELGGTLEVSSTPGAGARIALQLPARQQQGVAA
jgi:signal transduction histidine kinase